MLSLSSARELAVEAIKKSQNRYKHQYDRKAVQTDYCVGDWIFIRFPAVERGKNRKLSQPWQGPYRILQRKDPDITASKVYFPDEGQIQVHQQRVTRCPPELIAGYYWYGSAKHSFGRTLQWVQSLCAPSEPDQNMNDEDEIGIDDTVDNVSESHGSATTASQTTERRPPENCPYTLRKKIKPPARYQ